MTLEGETVSLEEFNDNPEVVELDFSNESSVSNSVTEKEVEATKQKDAPVAPKRSLLMLCLVCISGCGLFFAYDAPGALGPALKDQLGISESQIGYFYSVYSIAAIWPQPFGGFLLDRFGAKRMLIFGTALNTIGSAIFIVAPSYGVMIFGQVIFGLGSANLYMIAVATTGVWFSEADPKRSFKITVVSCLTTFVYRASSFASFNLLPIIVNRYSLKIALAVSTGTCVLSLVCAIIFALASSFDPYKEKPPVSNVVERKTLVKLDAFSVSSSTLLSEKEFSANENSSYIRKITIRERIGVQSAKLWTSVKALPMSYWCLLVIIITSTSSLFPFIGYTTSFLEEHRGYTAELAGQIASLSRVGSAVSTLVLAVSIGYLGKRTYFMILGNLLVLIVYVLFSYTTASPFALLIIIGVGQAIIDATAFPSVAIVVSPDILGKATSMCIFSYNVGLFIVPVIVGGLVDSVSYLAGLAVFVALGVASVAVSVVLVIADRRGGGKMDAK